MGYTLASVLSAILGIGVPALILYFVIKLAVKKAVIELIDEGFLDR